MKIEDVVFPLPLKQVGECIEVDAPRLTNRKKLNWGGETWFAHRLSYRLNCEEIPCRPPSLKEGLILHSCDNGWCVDPDHLSLGSSSKNTLEKIERFPNWRENLSKKTKEIWDNFTEEERFYKSRGLRRTRRGPKRENNCCRP